MEIPTSAISIGVVCSLETFDKKMKSFVEQNCRWMEKYDKIGGVAYLVVYNTLIEINRIPTSESNGHKVDGIILVDADVTDDVIKTVYMPMIKRPMDSKVQVLGKQVARMIVRHDVNDYKFINSLIIGFETNR